MMKKTSWLKFVGIVASMSWEGPEEWRHFSFFEETAIVVLDRVSKKKQSLRKEVMRQILAANKDNLSYVAFAHGDNFKTVKRMVEKKNLTEDKKEEMFHFLIKCARAPALTLKERKEIEKIMFLTTGWKVESESGNIEFLTFDNVNFRTVIHTTLENQVVVMSLDVGEKIDNEIHEDTTQFIKVEKGTGSAIVDGKNFELQAGSMVNIKAGQYHTIKNLGTEKLKLYTIYSPPHHAPWRVDVVKR